jgi:HEAT repeat protein
MRFFPIVAVIGGIALTAVAYDAPVAPTWSGVQQQCEDQELQRAAMNALLQMDAEQAMPILQKVLERRDPCSRELREKAVFVISQQETAETASILLDVVRNDPDADVRAKAVFWLSQVPGEATVVALDSLLLHSTDREVQEKALFALSQHDSERAGQALQAYAQSAEKPDALREKAIFWLSQHDDAGNVGFLQQLYGQLETRRLKERVIFGLSQRDEPEAVDYLMTIARTETDPDLQKKALFWLGQTNDPRVADFLLEIIGQ